MYNVKEYSDQLKTLLKFNDGIDVDTSGPIRKVRLPDGLYVVGQGMLIPCDTDEEAEKFITDWI